MALRAVPYLNPAFRHPTTHPTPPAPALHFAPLRDNVWGLSARAAFTIVTIEVAMIHEAIPNLQKFVEPDRVHRLVYTDPDIFDLEIKNIFETVWVYCGHASQVKKPGDYYTLMIGRQPMVMVRGKDMKVRVLHNRCPHRGVQLCGNTHGNTGSNFVCSYHAWSFQLDGKLEAIPLMKGYDGTRMTRDNPDCNVKAAARVDVYRGFVFASLSPTGPSLIDFLGEARVGIDDMCDRSPEGEVEVVPTCHRVIQHSNWKFFMENQLDSLHPSVTHQSTGVAASRVEKEIAAAGGKAPLYYHYLSTFASTFEQWDNVQTINFPRGHGVLKAYMSCARKTRTRSPTRSCWRRRMAKRRWKSTCRAAFTMCWCIRICRCSRRCSNCAACARLRRTKRSPRFGTFV